MTIEAVFFDLFETLVTEFADGRRRSNRNYDYAKLLGLPNEAFKSEWGKRQARRMNGEFAAFEDVIRDIVACRGLPVNETAIQELKRARIEEKRLPFRHIRPEIVELLAFLRGRGIKLGLISNCTEEEVADWRESELSAYFDDCLFSYEAKCSKPDAAIYRLACDRLGARPEACAFVGDGGSGELEGASRCGMRVYHAHWFNTYIRSEFAKWASPRELMREFMREAGPEA
ncbi:HAD family hydrolase [Paenibacillus glycinis]|uniref:HAD-IA family hydrolase n=1 Tax=Paenibacillus glycinis TaxID=2697035 RepID=A0ABW9XLD0_9BACL|nr:HAD-IA family hydrolase [Paenibacillus glycinis]NBD23249.1 HAD-IA family hydrolase [Paenibacillus glycinis]